MKMKYLIIGYGNDLRGDDAVGQRAVEQLSEKFSDIKWIQAGQLTPDFALDLSECDVCVFMDAYRANAGDKCQLSPLVASTNSVIDTHSASPAELMRLTKMTYGVSPTAWLISLPAVNFDISEELTETASNGIIEAKDIIQDLLDGNLITTPASRIPIHE